MPSKFYKDESRKDWYDELCPTQQLTCDKIQLGALLRIADATEVMAKNHQQLIDERNNYKRWYESERQTTEKLVRRISGLRGYIKRINKSRKLRKQ
jgi:hypothetical protein